MIEIKDLLVRFSSILFSEDCKREVVRKTISEIIKTEISCEDIKIKNNIIFLNLKPIYKNEIFLKQDQIFLKLGESLGKKAPQGIR